MLKNLTRRWNRSSLSLDEMWFLRDASAIDAASIEAAVKDVLEQIRSNGVGPMSSSARVAAFTKRRTIGTVKFGARSVIDQGRPRFFHNRFEGNFDEA
jgi:hypothetical protein